MAKHSRLFDLVKSLSAQEKRYFRLFSGLQSGEKTYLKLFDSLENQTIYDEVAIIQAFRGEKFVENLPVTKNYLTTQILKSLRNFNKGDEKEQEVMDLLEEVLILKKKGLNDHASSLLKKAKKIAANYELHQLHCLIIMKEIGMEVLRSGFEKKMELFQKEIDEASFKAEKEAQFYTFKNILQAYMIKGKESDVVKKEINSKWRGIRPFENEIERFSFRGKRIYLKSNDF